MTLRNFSITFLAATAALFSMVSCGKDETVMGDVLQDPTTLYRGIADTITGNDIYAMTLMEDSLLTVNYTTGVIGHYADATFGRVEACIYTQVSPVTQGVNFTDESGSTFVIDSVMLTLGVSAIFPDSGSHTLHITIAQLSETIDSAASYYATSAIPCGQSLLDTTFVFTPSSNSSDSLRLRLNDIAVQYFDNKKYGSQKEFKDAFKGMRISAEDDSDPLMLTIDFARSATMMEVYYTQTDPDNNKTTNSYINFAVGFKNSSSTATHFTQFEHDYSSSALSPIADGSQDSLDGTVKLYLEPFGGTYLYLNIDQWLKKFRADHPHATINYAELLLPADETDLPPTAILALKQYGDDGLVLTNDNNASTSPEYTGYDGQFHLQDGKGYYRLRISQHLQGLLRDGADYGLRLYLDGRRSQAMRTVVAGPQAAEPMRIAFIYVE